MNVEKMEKKYGVSLIELKDLNASKIKQLKNINELKLKETKKFKLVSSGIKTIVKGASIGIGASGTINTIFPNVFPMLITLYIGKSNLSILSQLTTTFVLSTSPVQNISGIMVTGIGAISGASVYTTYKLIKCGLETLEMKNDLKRIKKMFK